MTSHAAFLRTARRSGLCVGGLFFLVLGGIFTAAGVVKLVPELRYRNAGIHVRGTVAEKSIERAANGKSSTSYMIDYRFETLEGRPMEGSDEVDVDLWEELKEGDSFEIVYLPGSPQSNRSSATTEMPLALGFTGVGGFVFLVGAVVFGAGVRAALWRARILREGMLADAVVLEKRVSGSDKYLRFRYRDLSGCEHMYYDDTLTAEEYSRWEVGDTGKIRFDPDNPARSVWIGSTPAD
jgi:hypothetical protein